MAAGLPLTFCPALNVGLSLGEGRRKRGGTALVPTAKQPAQVDFILLLLPKGSSLAPWDTPHLLPASISDKRVEREVNPTLKETQDLSAPRSELSLRQRKKMAPSLEQCRHILMVITAMVLGSSFH